MTSRSSLPTRRGTAAVAVDEAALPFGGHSAQETHMSVHFTQLEKSIEILTGDRKHVGANGHHLRGLVHVPNLLRGVEEMERFAWRLAVLWLFALTCVATGVFTAA